MDPNAAWLTLCEWQNTNQERAQAASDLVIWLDRGGFPPEGISRETAYRQCATLLANVWAGL